jgi:hypothetical protein
VVQVFEDCGLGTRDPEVVLMARKLLIEMLDRLNNP